MELERLLEGILGAIHRRNSPRTRLGPSQETLGPSCSSAKEMDALGTPAEEGKLGGEPPPEDQSFRHRPAATIWKTQGFFCTFIAFLAQHETVP